MDLTGKRCEACEGKEDAFTGEEEDEYLGHVEDWSIDRKDVHKIRKNFSFKDFKGALAFVNGVGDLAEREGHHPHICFTWGSVTVEIWTHAVQGLTENDFILAAKIDALDTDT